MNKKILVSVLFLSIIIFCFPLLSRAVGSGPIMQLTVTLTSFRSPARAALGNLSNPQSTEFIIGSNRVIVVKNDTGTISISGSSIVGSGTQFKTDFAVGQYITTINATGVFAESHVITAIADDTHMTTDAWVNNVNNVAYSGPIEAEVSLNGSYPPYNSSNPLSFPYDSTQSYSVFFGDYAYPLNSNIGCRADCSTVSGGTGWYYLTNGSYSSAQGWAYCPTPTPCNGGASNQYQYIAVAPGNIFKDNSYSGNYYWRVLLQTIPAS